MRDLWEVGVEDYVNDQIINQKNNNKRRIKKMKQKICLFIFMQYTNYRQHQHITNDCLYS
jgi:hypothetical protein